jgi:hypothetical protein
MILQSRMMMISMSRMILMTRRLRTIRHECLAYGAYA